MREIVRMQIGKNGLTESLVNQLKVMFEKESIIKVSLLKASTRNREEAKEIGEELIKKLGPNYTYKKIGYTLVVQKWRRPRK